MSQRYKPYNPDQAYLLPPNVREVLGEDHLALFVHRVVEGLDLSEFVQAYGEEGGAVYAPELMLKVWLYAYVVGVTSARRLEQRIREDLAFRYLAGGATPDNWALSAFRRRHAPGINDVFTQVLEAAQKLGMARLGHLAWIRRGCAEQLRGNGMDQESPLRRERARLRRQIRRWQKACNAQDPDESAGMQVAVPELERRLEQIPKRLERLRKSGLRQISRSDPESRFLRSREGWQLGYTAEVAVSEDHLIVAQRVTQNASDNSARCCRWWTKPSRNCRGKPERVSADTRLFLAGEFARSARARDRRLCAGRQSELRVQRPGKSAGNRTEAVGCCDREHRRMRRSSAAGGTANLRST